MYICWLSLTANKNPLINIAFCCRNAQNVFGSQKSIFHFLQCPSTFGIEPRSRGSGTRKGREREQKKGDRNETFTAYYSECVVKCDPLQQILICNNLVWK